MTLVGKAKEFATRRHEGQKRKFSDAPYIVHPEHVYNVLRCYYGFDENLLAAAWLHDVLEDTNTWYSEIYWQFNTDVATLVGEVTNPWVEKLGRSARWQGRLEHIKQASRRGKVLKLADRTCNLLDYYLDWDTMPEKDKDFVQYVYLNETKELLEALQDADKYMSSLLRHQIGSLERKVIK